ncbi:MAG: hypothetical protein KF749_09805 [Bacteroidetes bacterium]|nr:hypothetical protein [Bacteroidota bacterium]MCW5895041.1 hypothetical protein [Bacteroidota bacterium]
MRHTALIVTVLLLSCTGYPQIGGYPDFELVESIPVETTLDNPDMRNTQEVWLEMINGAKKTLDIEQFYVSNKPGEPLEDVILAIEAAARRGVNVRLIADARFQKTYPETIERLAKQKNITARIIDFGKLANGVQHAKFFTVDGEMVFVGSQNFDWRALKHIHELGLKIKHKETAEFYQDVFTLDWNLAESNDKANLSKLLSLKTYHTPFTTVVEGDTLLISPTASPVGFIPDTGLWDERHMVRIIDEAKEEVSLKFLGYDTRGRDGSEYLALDNALRRAAARGVTVRLLVSDWGKGTSAEKSLKALTQIPNIEVRFMVIPEWSGGYVSFARVQHCKFILADASTFWLGTSNAEKSYFYNTRGLGVVVKNGKLSGLLQRVFTKSWNSEYSEPVNPTAKYERRKRDGE